MTKVTQAHSTSRLAKTAVKEIFSQLRGESVSNVLVFISPQYDRVEMEKALAETFAIPVYGCTTAGEIGLNGYQEFSIAALGFHGSTTKVYSSVLTTLKAASEVDAKKCFLPNAEFVKKHTSGWFPKNSFNVLLSDGLSKAEDRLVTAIHSVLPSNSPVVGGSAGDDLRFESTFIIDRGKYISNAALLLSFATDLPIFPFKTQHFLPSEKKLTVTKAHNGDRIVFSFDNITAANAYAKLVGVEVSALDSHIFSKYPLLRVSGEERDVVAIQGVNSDRSLSFLASISNGETLHLGMATDYLRSLEDTFAMVKDCQQDTQAVLCFECILRRLEVLGSDLQSTAGNIFASNKGVGFHTYGEQFFSRHVNQTLTGIAIGNKNSN